MYKKLFIPGPTDVDPSVLEKMATAHDRAQNSRSNGTAKEPFRKNYRN